MTGRRGVGKKAEVEKDLIEMEVAKLEEKARVRKAWNENNQRSLGPARLVVPYTYIHI